MVGMSEFGCPGWSKRRSSRFEWIFVYQIKHCPSKGQRASIFTIQQRNYDPSWWSLVNKHSPEVRVMVYGFWVACWSQGRCVLLLYVVLLAGRETLTMSSGDLNPLKVFGLLQTQRFRTPPPPNQQPTINELDEGLLDKVNERAEQANFKPLLLLLLFPVWLRFAWLSPLTQFVIVMAALYKQVHWSV